MPAFFQKPLTSEQAKDKVFEHWKDLENFANKRFPNDENQANIALDFVLEQLQTDNWKRIRQWEKKGNFLTFLLTIVARLFTDFTRKQFGHHRPPKWLIEKQNPLWLKSYKLLVVEQYSRNESIELLKSDRFDLPLIEEIVNEILKKCKAKPQPPQFSSADELEQLGSENTEPSKELSLGTTELIEILTEVVTTGNDDELPDYLREHLSLLRSSTQLDEQDRMFLYLRFIEGKSMTEIVNLLHMQDNPYRKLHKLIHTLQKACQDAGLIYDEIRE